MTGRLVLLALVWQAAARSATVAAIVAALVTPSTAHSAGNKTIGNAAPFNASLLPEEPWFPYKPLLLECFPKLSWPCAQTKLLLYLDQLNRAKRVHILGNLVTLEKTRPDQTPPLTEEVLVSRNVARDQTSLLSLLQLVTDRFIDTHVIRLDLPAWDGARLVTEPVEISFVEDETEEEQEVDTGNRQGRGKKKKKKDKKKKKGGKKMMKMMMEGGKKMVEMVGKMIMVKVMMMAPIAMKKGMIGGMAGLMSMGMMKFMLLKKLLSLLKKKCSGGGGPPPDDSCGGGDSGGYGRIEWARNDAYRGAYPTVAAPAPAGGYYQPYAYDYWRHQPQEEKTWTLWR